jgi:hypothetical protein
LVLCRSVKFYVCEAMEAKRKCSAVGGLSPIREEYRIG